MKQAKRKLISVLTALMITVSLIGTTSVKAEEFTLPKIDKVFIEHTPVLEGEMPELFVTSNYEGEVQYKLFFQTEDGQWASTSYGDPIDAKTPAKLTIGYPCKTGKNYVVIWVKRANVVGNTVQDYKGKEVSFDTFDMATFQVTPSSEAKSYGELNYTKKDLTVTVAGIKGMDDETEYMVYAYDYQNARWIGTGEFIEEYKGRKWTTGPVDFTLPAKGTYLIKVQAKRPGADNYDVEKLESVTDEKEGIQEIEILSTSTEPDGFCGKLTVNLTDDGKATFKDAKKFKIYKEGYDITNPTILGETSFVFPHMEEGTMVKIELLDINDAIVETFEEVFVGETVKIQVETENEENK